jgi:hypothetical protein
VNASCPPPVLDSARLIAFANVPEHVPFTGRIHLNVGGEWLGRVENLAICRNYCKPDDLLLLFCDADWQSQGCIPFTTVEEAKLKAERGYTGVSELWQESPYDDVAVDSFLRDEYGVDPKAEWWSYRCSFCQAEVEGQGITKGWATICASCVETFHAAFHASDT